MTSSRAMGQSLVVAVEGLQHATEVTASQVINADDCLQAYQREFDYLVRSLRRLGVPRSELEDVVHEVFLVLYRRWGDYDPSRAIRPWLFGIAFRVASSQRRRHSREVPHAAIEAEDLAPRPDQAVAAEQTRQLVLKAIEEIPMERRAVLVMHDLDNVSMREIAALLSIPLFTAYSRLRKARKEFETAAQRLQNGALRP